MFSQRKPLFISSHTPRDKVQAIIDSESREILENRDKMRPTIEDMILQINEALDYIGYVDVPDETTDNNDSGSTTDTSSAIEIL